MNNQSPLTRLCQDIYNSIKAQHPGEGRRKWRLRVAELFWELDSESKKSLAQIGISPTSCASANFVTDPDPWDKESRDISEIGILVRTDYTNEEAWQTFYAKLQEAEQDFAADAVLEDDNMAEDEPAGSNVSKEDQAMQEEEEESSDEEDTAPVFHIINPQTTEGRARFTSISNIAALRLLNDMDICPAPTPPEGTKRIKSPNRLIDHHGWQETYCGNRNIWIYDGKSNEDQCVRLINQRGDMYGTATGDSWRARVSHICELQINLYSGAMKIDFGGLDRWDYNERLRNVQEATVAIT